MSIFISVPKLTATCACREPSVSLVSLTGYLTLESRRMHLHRGIVQFFLCLSVALAGSSLAQAQEAVPRTLSEVSTRTEATPTASAEKPSIEISAGTPNEKPATIVEQTPPPEELAKPAVAVEKKTPPVRPAIVQRKAPEPTPATPMSLSALKAVAVSAPVYPIIPTKPGGAHITGSGVCGMVVNTASGRVISATMAQSTGNVILDKITTSTCRRWRFKPGTVSQLQVPIRYE